METGSMSNYMIFVCDRGHVLFGELAGTTQTPTGLEWRIENGACITRWGTGGLHKNAGLGLLQRAGPTDKTRLDAEGPVLLHEAQCVKRLPVHRSVAAAFLERISNE